MFNLKEKEFWFLAGSQHLYGEGIFKEIAAHSDEIAKYLDEKLPCKVIFKSIVTTPEQILNAMQEANYNKNCAGVITWMHTFSPSKMWIAGLNILKKPVLHLHTQYNRDIPWDTIDMDFMNLNQSAHGDREHGFIMTRMGIRRKVVVGHWKEDEVISEIETWVRAAAAWSESQNLKVARFGDNMREVAVTEGDKVEAQIKLGWAVNGYGLGDLVQYVNEVKDSEIDALMDEYKEKYIMNTQNLDAVREQAKIEIGMRRFLENGKFGAFTTTFENLHGLRQLPGLAVQRLMEEGYGFGAEGDWKTSALTRVMKYMAAGLPGGTSFMEDYTYHLEMPDQLILGAHMLEVCPTVAGEKPKIEVHPLGIGGKEDPARLVFDGASGRAIAATLVDLGNRFRMIVSEIELVKPTHDMPKLPVARLLWKPLPNLKVNAKAWIYAGGAHHTVLTTALNWEHLYDFCTIAGIEFVHINENTNIPQFKQELLQNEIVYKFL